MKTEKEQEELAKVIIEEWSNLSSNRVKKEINKGRFRENIDIWYKDYFERPSPKIVYCDSLKELPKLGGKDIMLSKLDMILSSLRNDKLPELSQEIKLIADSVFLKVNPLFPISFEEEYYRNLVGNSISYCRIFILYGACFDFLDRVGIITNPLIKAYIELAKTPAFLLYLCEDCVFVVQPPTEINIENNLHHSTKGAALKFRDGDEYYLIRGVEIEKGIFKKIRDKSITLEEILEIPNEEIKSAVLSMYQELYGPEETYQFISRHLKEVDSYYHKTGDKTLCYTLFKGQLGIYEVAYIRCYCPSTDRMFFLGVDSRNTNAKYAIASLYRIPRRLKLHIKYINRQGERFTTILTDTGERIRKKMTKEDFEDLTIISGDDYFELMRYEY